VTATVAAVLGQAGVEHGLFGAVEPNPGTSVVARGGDALRAFGLAGTVVVPIGGGSSMDTAKALSLYAVNAVPAAELGYDNPALLAGLPLIAVPTTAGTGAETNSFGVITDEAAGRKSYVGHPSVLPRACILDPELTLRLPPAATAATGLDAMTHSLESLLSRNPNPFAEALALQVIRTVAGFLPRAVADGSDLEARSQLLFASHLAGIGQASGTGVGLVHALGHALAHGLHHDGVGVGARPAAVLEAAAPVLVGPARRLHHSVQGQADGRDDLAHSWFLSGVLARGPASPRGLSARMSRRGREDRRQ
jgi:alcohol dehydrogenase